MFVEVPQAFDSTYEYAIQWLKKILIFLLRLPKIWVYKPGPDCPSPVNSSLLTHEDILTLVQ